MYRRARLSVTLSPLTFPPPEEEAGIPLASVVEKPVVGFSLSSYDVLGETFRQEKMLASYRLGKSFLRYIHRAYKVIHDFDFLPRLRIPFLFGNLYSVHERIDYFLIKFVELRVFIQKP